MIFGIIQLLMFICHCRMDFFNMEENCLHISTICATISKCEGLFCTLWISKYVVITNEGSIDIARRFYQCIDADMDDDHVCIQIV